MEPGGRLPELVDEAERAHDGVAKVLVIDLDRHVHPPERIDHLAHPTEDDGVGAGLPRWRVGVELARCDHDLQHEHQVVEPSCGDGKAAERPPKGGILSHLD